MELIKQTNKVTRVEEMTQYQPSINELKLKLSYGDLRKGIFIIVSKVLAAYDPDKVKIQEFGYELLIEGIISEHGNLELQEIDYALKKGVLGVYGAIYGDIQINTVMTWLNEYKERDRAKRPEPTKEVQPKYTGMEISLTEFYARNPDMRERAELTEILNKALTNKITLDDIKNYYSYRGLTLDHLKDDMEAISKMYYQQPETEREYYSESQYILDYLTNFVKSSFNKTIES